MGLSDGERYQGVVAAVHEMYQERTKLRGAYEARSITPLLRRLWVDFLGDTANSAHWIVGSDSDASYLGECSLLCAEFARVMGMARGRGKAKSRGEEPDRAVHRWKVEFLGGADQFLDGPDEALWRLARLCESYFYYANRYPDRLSRRFAKVTATVATIRGHLHAIFRGSEVHCKAWMMRHIVDALIPWDDEDPISQIGQQQHWHINLKAQGVDFVMVETMFRRYQFRQEHSPETRLLDAVALMGPRYPYPHEHRALIAHVEAWNNHEVEVAMSNKDYTAGRIDQNKVRAALAKCVKEEPPSYEPYCYLTGQGG